MTTVAKPKYVPVPLDNLSKKSMEAKTKAILRVNPNASVAAFMPSSNTVSIKEMTGKYAIPKTKGMATGPQPLSKEPYSTGDGEFQNYGSRPGCMDFMKCPSFGVST